MNDARCCDAVEGDSGKGDAGDAYKVDDTGNLDNAGPTRRVSDVDDTGATQAKWTQATWGQDADVSLDAGEVGVVTTWAKWVTQLTQAWYPACESNKLVFAWVYLCLHAETILSRSAQDSPYSIGRRGSAGWREYVREKSEASDAVDWNDTGDVRDAGVDDVGEGDADDGDVFDAGKAARRPLCAGLPYVDRTSLSPFKHPFGFFGNYVVPSMVPLRR
ncbi:uncharacterized protein BXZ73DRAFT_82842 [Epithele typhae]|uniref:uncharacterized protein n=1 Tax=Epithele typhae TaxID=378194 RepID=UPI002007A5E7|nr:uncharacterized protein BXZ73DRAFT_82842 [Epithele typhae]KAH9911367.1 hypothetical protein BXZ73DRAFT_82842 [Epithele typhae]